MKHISKLSTLTVLITLACSCCNTSRYEKLETDVVEELHSQVLNDTFMFGNIDGMWMYDSLLIVLDYKQDRIIQYFNKNTGENIGGEISHGQGVQELTTVYNTYFNTKTGILSLYDANSNKLLACRLPELNTASWYCIEMPKYNQSPNYIYPLDNNTFLGQHGRTRFTLAHDGEVVARMNEYPDIPEVDDDEQVKNRVIDSQARYAISPDETKIVQTTATGSIMQILNINESSIEPATVRYFHKPYYRVIKGQIGMTEETIYGFTNIQVTNRFIYATHSGIANPTECPRNILIFDWNGQLVKELSTDHPIWQFYVDEPNGKIYAATFNEEKELMLVTMDYEI